jgi:hypothetical protein
MLQRFEAILLFYKPYVLWSFAITVLLAIFNSHILPILITKLILILLLWYVMNETTAKRKLIFYKNLGISNIRLFSTLILIDIFISIPIIFLIQAFIWF